MAPYSSGVCPRQSLRKRLWAIGCWVSLWALGRLLVKDKPGQARSIPFPLDLKAQWIWGSKVKSTSCRAPVGGEDTRGQPRVCRHLATDPASPGLGALPYPSPTESRGCRCGAEEPWGAVGSLSLPGTEPTLESTEPSSPRAGLGPWWSLRLPGLGLVPGGAFEAVVSAHSSQRKSDVSKSKNVNVTFVDQ